MSSFAPKAGLIETDLESELVLLDPETKLMFSLNATGRLVWRGLGAGEEETAMRLAREFTTGIGRAREDVRHLLEELAGAGLIVPRDA